MGGAIGFSPEGDLGCECLRVCAGGCWEAVRVRVERGRRRGRKERRNGGRNGEGERDKGRNRDRDRERDKEGLRGVIGKGGIERKREREREREREDTCC
jgi:hypothetical protein